MSESQKDEKSPPPDSADELRFPETKPTAVETAPERMPRANAPTSRPPSPSSSRPPSSSLKAPRPPLPPRRSDPPGRTSDPAMRRASHPPTQPNDALSSQSVSRPLHELPVIGNFGRFALLGRLAFGGMAEIFLAREDNAQSGGHRHIVVKRILPHVADDESFVQMFLDEARLAIRLAHPNICHIYEFGQTEGSYFIAMEWVNGVPLGKLLRKAREGGGMSTRIATRVIAQVAEALHYAHRACDEQGQPLGIVHRDVSLQNIMVSYEGTVKLLDFGVAKAATHSTKTSAGVVKGKLSYMAPEQARGEEVDARADVFALGICLYEAITCRALYHRGSEYETLRAIIDGPVPSARAVDPTVPAALDAIVQRALQKNPSERYADAGEMQNALEMYLADQRLVVGSAQVREYLRGLYAEEIARGPLVESSPFVLPAGTPSDRPARASHVPTSSSNRPLETVAADTERPPAKRSRVLLAIAVALGAVVVALLTARIVERRTGQRPMIDEAVLRTLPRPVETPRVQPTSVEPAPPPAAIEPQAPIPEAELPLDWNAPRPPNAPVNKAPSTPRPPAASQARGVLSLNTRPWSKVYLGSRLLGMTPLGNVEVPAGEITLRLEDRDGVSHRRTLSIREGERASEFFDLSEN